MNVDQLLYSLYKRGSRLTTMIIDRDRLSAHIHLPPLHELSPSFVRHTAVVLPRGAFFVPMPASTPPRGCRQAIFLSHVRSEYPTPLSRPLPSRTAFTIALLRASRSPRRGNLHARRPATCARRPTHAPPLRSPCPSSFTMTS
jgi:hypothetical protein